ncbi:heme exporter protein CcmD [Aurantiacibacter aquimixticola]|uniref:Heme exporter protein CcmD n=1 Tax=Aurantiacibacter aquimixticola TaxID=1958945 RepID=A0A419RWG0_9SPHN|nr:heme exporter protein CcmD [Aurantiacibacter aquimixticola]RJY10135.1 heme exporter protein CcmD [Aurantiacibacter aquimixticola]
MREALDQMVFVYAAYGVTVLGTLALMAQSWLAMRRAEKRRDEAKRR